MLDFHMPTFDLTEYLAEKERAALEALHLRRPHYKQVQKRLSSGPGDEKARDGRADDGDTHDEETPQTLRKSLTSDFESGQSRYGEQGRPAPGSTDRSQEEHEFVPVLSLPSPDMNI